MMWRRMLLMGSLSMLAILLYVYGEQILTDVTRQTPKLEEVLPETASKPAPVAPAISAGLNHQTKGSSQKKQPAPTRHLKANQVSHPVVKPAKKQIVAEKKPSYQPEVKLIEHAPAPKPAGHWIKSISGQGVRVNFRKTEPLAEDCGNRDCSAKKDGYTVAGVVVKSDRFDTNKPLIDGEVAVGDAQEKPLVHLK